VGDYRIVTDMKNVDGAATGAPDIGSRGRAAATARYRHDECRVRYHRRPDPSLVCLPEAFCTPAAATSRSLQGAGDFATSLGFTIVAAGKGKNNPLDRHASPADPAVIKEAARRGLSPNMLIEFVDGSKTMIEMASVSNATGLIPDVRGMHGPETDRDHLNQTFALQEDGGVLNKMGVDLRL
jgi:hypothetical protein